MARIKKTSKVIENARTRLAGLKSISASLDLGNGVTSEIFEEKISKGETSLETYNTRLSLADEGQALFEADEKDIAEFSERVLLSVAAKYGKDSLEYEKAGGTRKSERKKPIRAKNNNNQ